MNIIALFFLTVVYFFRNKFKELILRPLVVFYNIVKRIYPIIRGSIKEFLSNYGWHNELQSTIWLGQGILFLIILLCSIGTLMIESRWTVVLAQLILFGVIATISLIIYLGWMWSHYWSEKVTEWISSNKRTFTILIITTLASVILGIVGFNTSCKPYTAEKVRDETQIIGAKYKPWKILTNTFGDDPRVGMMDVVFINNKNKVYMCVRHIMGGSGAIETNLVKDICITTGIWVDTNYFRHTEKSEHGYFHYYHFNKEDMEEDGLVCKTNFDVKYKETVTPPDRRPLNAIIGTFSPWVALLLIYCILIPFGKFLVSNWVQARKEAYAVLYVKKKGVRNGKK